jgi:hypothetical protein
MSSCRLIRHLSFGILRGNEAREMTETGAGRGIGDLENQKRNFGSLLRDWRSLKRMLRVLVMAGILMAVNLPSARAQSAARLPAAVLEKGVALHQVGKGTHSIFGLRVYQVTLWATSSKWNPQEPHALDIESNRAVSKTQLTDAGMNEMQRQGVGTSAQRQAWRRELERVLPAVNRGDQLVVYSGPSRKTYFFYNGRERGEIDDPAFGAAFFGIWLDPRTNNPALRRSLLNH